MAKRTPEEWGKVYTEKRPLYENFTTKLHELIKVLVSTYDIDVQQIEYRTKTVESFTEKIQRPGKRYDDPLTQVTDFSGIRIITYYLEDADKIRDMLNQEFEIDEANSVDKAQIADPDRFGYLSVHYVVSLLQSRKKLTEWKHCSNLKAEIQVRTVLQHAWAAIDHKLRYKAPRDVPTTLRRQLFRLSALLELADDEFSGLRARSEKLSEQYAKDVSKGEYNMELNLNSMDAYLGTTKQHLKWEKIALDLGFRKHEFIDAGHEAKNRRDLLNILQSSGILTIRDFNKLIDKANDWGKDLLARVYQASTKRHFAPHAVLYDILVFLTIYGKRESLDISLIHKIGYRHELEEALIEAAGLSGNSHS